MLAAVALRLKHGACRPGYVQSMRRRAAYACSHVARALSVASVPPPPVMLGAMSVISARTVAAAGAFSGMGDVVERSEFFDTRTACSAAGGSALRVRGSLVSVASSARLASLARQVGVGAT